LLWTKIGTAPEGTYALAAYHGRLFALVGSSTTNPTLYWRQAVPSQGFPYRAPSLLLLNGSAFAIRRLASNGDFETTGQGTLDFSYTHVTRANDGLVFFYDGSAGHRSGVVVRFNADGTYSKVKTYPNGSFGQWTHIVYVRAGRRSWGDVSPIQEKVLFYAGTTVYIGYFNPTTGDFVSQWNSGAFSAGWTHITCTYKGDLLFYNSNAASGSHAWGQVDNNGVYWNEGNGSGMGSGWQFIVQAGHTYLLFYKSDATAKLRELFNGLVERYSPTPTLGPNRILTSNANGAVLTYSSSTGDGRACGFSSGVMTVLRNHPAPGFGAAWQTVVGIGILS
jgi:hypothetical protein